MTDPCRPRSPECRGRTSACSWRGRAEG